MKNKQILPLLIAGITSVSLHGHAQTTPTGADTSTTYPTGAVAPDSQPMPKASRKTGRMAKRNSRNADASAAEKAKYRQSSTSNGTSVNNSNSTNYNSNNATNPATGVGSATATTGANPSKPPRR